MNNIQTLIKSAKGYISSVESNDTTFRRCDLTGLMSDCNACEVSTKDAVYTAWINHSDVADLLNGDYNDFV